MESILFENRKDIQNYANAIHNVLGVDVDISDHCLIRVAGTGIFENSIGTDVLKNAMVIKTVMAMHKHLIIEHPGMDATCLKCKEREHCKEKIEICVPIINEGQMLGAIAIGTSEEGIAKTINANIDNYLSFLKSIADLIASGVMEKSLHMRELVTKKTLEKVINRMDVGILITDENKQVNYINKAAERIIGTSKKQLEYLIKINQFSILSSDSRPRNENTVFNINVRNNRITLTGKISKIDIYNKKMGTLYIFEELIQVQRRIMRETNELYRFTFESIIGNDKQIVRAVETAKMMATLNKNILIVGENGTGKEILSRAIHNEGGKNKPLVHVMCSNSPKLLLENELFGSENNNVQGKLALAKGGTLYFDEISNMPIHLQSRLIEYLNHEKPDIRIIATTSKDLPKKVEQNLFRSDLLYKIREFEITMPPVRERSDLNYLLDFFKRKYEMQEGVTIKLADEVMSKLKSYDWLGNVREIDSVYSLFAVLSQSNDEITMPLLPSFLQETVQAGISYNLKQKEKETIVKVLNMFPDSVAGKKLAAKALGISIASLYRKVDKYGIKSDKTYV